ncbi:MAG: TVP38/TMEM64 family protein [Parcubacteria group bacterium]|nr:TVP38/TMEM64 family protein [Parcubacteria group bacterium]
MTRRTRIILFLIGIAPVAAFLLYANFRPLGILGSAEEIKAIVLSYGAWAWLVFIGLQILQVVVTPISHWAVGTAGGYIFGLWGGLLLNWVGRVIGHTIAFYLSRTFGRPLVLKLVGEETMKRYDDFCKKGGPVALALFYFMPLFPDDELSYIAGLSDMKRKHFQIAALIGHIGGSFGSALLGAGLSARSTWMLVLYGAAFVAVFGLWFFKKKMERWIFKKSAQVR